MWVLDRRMYALHWIKIYSSVYVQIKNRHSLCFPILSQKLPLVIFVLSLLTTLSDASFTHRYFGNPFTEKLIAQSDSYTRVSVLGGTECSLEKLEQFEKIVHWASTILVSIFHLTVEKYDIFYEHSTLNYTFYSTLCHISYSTSLHVSSDQVLTKQRLWRCGELEQMMENCMEKQPFLVYGKTKGVFVQYTVDTKLHTLGPTCSPKTSYISQLPSASSSMMLLCSWHSVSTMNTAILYIL